MTNFSSQATVLIVDDDAKSRMAIGELVESFGQETVLAGSGEDALRAALDRDFAVILLDARMPGMDGFETAQLLRQRGRTSHTPIIFLTGAYEDVSSMFRGYEAGAVDYIVKPLVPEVLSSKISVFVELYNKNAVLVREIAERKRTQEELKASEENLRALAAHLQLVREEEWTRIARDIHDELGQALTGLKMDLNWISKKLGPDQAELTEKAVSMSRLIDDTVQSVRDLASRLRPQILDQLGLAAAIEWQARDFQMRTGIRVRVDVSSETAGLEQERTTATFRIFQELLTNVARHANATGIDVSMKLDGTTLTLKVRDNGNGITEDKMHDRKSLGLLGMRERVLPFGGTLDISGKPGQGTKVRVTIPLALR